MTFLTIRARNVPSPWFQKLSGKNTEINLGENKAWKFTPKNGIIPADGEVTDSALLAPEAGAALIDPSLRCRVDTGPGVEASVCSRVAVPGPGTGQGYFSPAFTFK